MLSNVLVSIAIWLNTLTNFNSNLFDRRKYRAEFSSPSSYFPALYPYIELSFEGEESLSAFGVGIQPPWSSETCLLGN